MSTSAPKDFGDIPYTQKAEIDDICDRFEDELKAGQRPRAEEFLKLADRQTWPTLVRELLGVEVGYRSDNADVVREEYETRFPDLRAAIQSTPSFATQQDFFSHGTQLGDFQIQQQIGAGGMGVVYEARDMKLGRNVALKVLPSVFANDTDRLERFDREAKVLATLNHPNIATLYGFEEHHGIRFCILELVPGKTLAEMLVRRPLPAEDVKTVFGQIAAALEAAHAQGIIHRDLKPANVKVTPDGKVKLLDFGLATSFKLTGGEQDIGSTLSVSDTNTVAGAVAGTVPYMSPEQARGKPVDKRTDVWAFGCCLYEALTGRKAFAGETTTDVLAAIVDSEPDWEALPDGTPPSVRFLLDRCLQKEPEKRLRDLGDAWIDDAYFDSLLRSSSSSSRRPKNVFWRWAIPCLVCTVVATLVIWSWQLIPRRVVVPTRWLTVNLPTTKPVAVADSAQLGEGRPSITLTPDGSQLVYVANISGVPRLCVRPMDHQVDQLEATVIDGTDGAFNPFISPDGEWVGFFADNELKKVSMKGGQPISLCDAIDPYGASWGWDGNIYFAELLGRVLSRVFDQEGNKERIASSPLANRYIWPEVLPAGKGLLVYQEGKGIIRVSSTGEEELVFEQGTHARYVASGHLVYAQPGRVLAVPFDLDRMKVTGSSVPVVDHVRTESRGAAQICTAQDGSMVFIPGGSAAYGTLVKVPVEGPSALKEEESLGFPGDFYGTFELSPDGDQIAIVVEGTTRDIWVFDRDRKSRTLLTSEGINRTPIWTPDGESVIFSSDISGVFNLFRRSANQIGGVERLTTSTDHQYVSHWFADSDGQWLAIKTLGSGGNRMLSVDTKEERPLPRTHLAAQLTMLSPDGRWIAYGNDQVWVQRFPGPGRKEQVSTEGGEEAVWSPSGDRLYYRNGRKWMAVAVETEPELTLGDPQTLFESDYLNVRDRSYDITPDGKHFILLRGKEAAAPTQVHVVLNWFDELRRLAPPSHE